MVRSGVTDGAHDRGTLGNGSRYGEALGERLQASALFARGARFALYVCGRMNGAERDRNALQGNVTHAHDMSQA